jgi:flagellar biosynthesis GTPase FlhF
MRGPEGHEETQTETKAEEIKTEESLITANAEEKTEEKSTVEENKTEEVKTEEVKVEPLTVESLSIPEGFELQEEFSNKYLEILNGDMEPKDRANALLTLHSETMNAAEEARSKAWDDLQTTWKDEAKTEFKEKLQPTISNINKLVDEFGDDKLVELFGTTGAGNSVHMIKFLGKIADVLTEGNFFKAGSPSGQDDPNAAAKRLFPSAT